MPGNLLEENRPVPWDNQDICLYHGTDIRSAEEISEGKITLRKGRSFTDFGPGFYGTTLLSQARNWAFKRSMLTPSLDPAVVKLSVSRSALAEMRTLAFVLGDKDSVDFWSFVWYCRGGASDHRIKPTGLWEAKSYDLVIGPVAADWQQRMLAAGADQYGFHTDRAINVLNTWAEREIVVL